MNGNNSSDPEKVFKSTGCRTCISRPCRELVFGAVYPGKFMLVPSREMGHGSCPFLAATDEIPFLFDDIPVEDLVFLVEGLVDDLGSTGHVVAPLGQYCSGYEDHSGYVAFIEAVVRDGSVRVVRIPFDYERDPVLRKWFRKAAPEIPEMAAAEDEDVRAALTDAIDEESPSGTSTGTVRLRLDIDPDDESAGDDTYTLFSTDTSKTYRRTLTVKDDKVPGDGSLDLEFTGVPDSLSYTLEIDPGKEGKPYRLFKNVKYKDL